MSLMHARTHVCFMSSTLVPVRTSFLDYTRSLHAPLRLLPWPSHILIMLCFSVDDKRTLLVSSIPWRGSVASRAWNGLEFWI